jgi:hypothetical protein
MLARASAPTNVALQSPKNETETPDRPRFLGSRRSSHRPPFRTEEHGRCGFCGKQCQTGSVSAICISFRCHGSCATPKSKTNALLEGDDLLVRHGVGLGNDGNEVDFGVQATHKLDVDRLQPDGCTMSAPLPTLTDGPEEGSSRMAGRFDEIEAGMNTVIDHFKAVDAVFLF